MTDERAKAVARGLVCQVIAVIQGSEVGGWYLWAGCEAGGRWADSG